MERILEPEVMDGEDQSIAYAMADFSAPNAAFVARFQELFPQFKQGKMLDLGCGPADIVIRFCHALPRIDALALDASPAMLKLAHNAICTNNLQNRIDIREAYLPCPWKEARFDAIVSNSLLHHLPNPEVLWKTIAETGKPGAPILVVDLQRARSQKHARDIVETYASEEAEILQHDFYHSLCAAFTPAEIRQQLHDAGLGYLHVEEISDRHLAVWGHWKGSDLA